MTYEFCTQCISGRMAAYYVYADSLKSQANVSTVSLTKGLPFALHPSERRFASFVYDRRARATASGVQ